MLDILKHVHHWVPYKRHFGPLSGSEPKLADTIRRYLFAVFGYGCNLGASQTARHAPDMTHRQTLRRINTQHINAAKLEAALNNIIAEYARFPWLCFWGDKKIGVSSPGEFHPRAIALWGSRDKGT